MHAIRLAVVVLLVVAASPNIPPPTVTFAVEQTDAAAEFLRRATAAAADGDSERAVDLAAAAIARDRDLGAAFYLRGRERFRLGKVRDAVADFDQFVKLRPEAESRQWERGIALYYAGRFERGAKQFEMYQTYHDNDVENSVWRFLCEARTTGVEAARKNILPIRNDPRVPMMQIYDLFRGTAEPQAVFTAAAAGSPADEVLDGRMFYARLYVGLYFEAIGDEARARELITAAAERHRQTKRINRYMWDVARIHAERLQAERQR